MANERKNVCARRKAHNDQVKKDWIASKSPGKPKLLSMNTANQKTLGELTTPAIAKALSPRHLNQAAGVVGAYPATRAALTKFASQIHIPKECDVRKDLGRINRELVEQLTAVGIEAKDFKMENMWTQDIEDPTEYDPDATYFPCGSTGAVWKWAGPRAWTSVWVTSQMKQWRNERKADLQKKLNAKRQKLFVSANKAWASKQQEVPDRKKYLAELTTSQLRAILNFTRHELGEKPVRFVKSMTKDLVRTTLLLQAESKLSQTSVSVPQYDSTTNRWSLSEQQVEIVGTDIADGLHRI